MFLSILDFTSGTAVVIGGSVSVLSYIRSRLKASESWLRIRQVSEGVFLVGIAMRAISYGLQRETFLMWFFGVICAMIAFVLVRSFFVK